jgi:hypothetical protein
MSRWLDRKSMFIIRSVADIQEPAIERGIALSPVTGGASVMPTILDYILREDVFEPETLAAMGDAYDRALRSLDAKPSCSARETIAARIISLARKGERDPRKLCEDALSASAVHGKREKAD